MAKLWEAMNKSLVTSAEFLFSKYYTLAKTEIIYPKNVGTLVAVNFT